MAEKAPGLFTVSPQHCGEAKARDRYLLNVCWINENPEWSRPCSVPPLHSAPVTLNSHLCETGTTLLLCSRALVRTAFVSSCLFGSRRPLRKERSLKRFSVILQSCLVPCITTTCQILLFQRITRFARLQSISLYTVSSIRLRVPWGQGLCQFHLKL